MNNELFNHQKSDAVKWVCTLLAFLIVGVLIAGIICGWFDKKETPAHRTDGNGLYRNARRNERRFAIRQSDVGKRKRGQRIGRKQLYGNGDHSARYGIATCKLVGRVEKRQFCVGYGQDGNGLCNDNARGRGRAHGYACLRKALFGTGDTHGERGGQRG